MEKKSRRRRSRLVISSDLKQGPEGTIPDLLAELSISSEVQEHQQEREEDEELEPPEQQSSRALKELQAL